VAKFAKFQEVTEIKIRKSEQREDERIGIARSVNDPERGAAKKGRLQGYQTHRNETNNNSTVKPGNM
jgi:hypothetical protein